MNPKSSSFPFMIIISMIIFNISTTIVVANFVEKTCKKCEKNNPNVDYEFCVSSFRSHPGSDSADLRKLGAISLHLIGNNVSNSAEYVEGLLHKKEVDPYKRARLNDCLEVYCEAVVSVEEGKKAYKEGRYDDVNIKVSSVMDAGRVCEDGFREKEGLSSPLTRWNNDTFKLTAIALSIINMLS
ncbi:putative invertase inhibitor [Cucurbita pepo subsp. pepo]|uniref:putative invertase inhibitor n=1 Tax=Cucurbita pepo subsp. pepo TaxID=3664 RepID=UPI000C9DA3B6|nr:putative invertase inhibitor [Cucurbita pepo subsp. pepo]